MQQLFNILLLNGPNLNYLGRREPNKYGFFSLNEIVENMIAQAKLINIRLYHFQSNSEDKLIEIIYESIHEHIDYIILNPAGYTHTSIALRDALLAVNIPFIEVHISNIYARETFRKNSYFSDIAAGFICGLGPEGYFLALDAVVYRLKKNNY
ncbi:MAG: type II 3-dehydroquinate dehydratase [Candidatus Dasytiphilus stammeri]